jgi:hypothetical protein
MHIRVVCGEGIASMFFVPSGVAFALMSAIYYWYGGESNDSAGQQSKNNKNTNTNTHSML